MIAKSSIMIMIFGSYNLNYVVVDDDKDTFEDAIDDADENAGVDSDINTFDVDAITMPLMM